MSCKKTKVFLQLIFRGVKKRGRISKLSEKQSFALFFGYPKAYKGTPRGEVCL